MLRGTSAPGPSPTPNPNPVQTPRLATFEAKAVTAAGPCISGAILEIVGGEVPGQKFTQDQPCGAWDGDGFILKGLTPDLELVLRFSAPGYAARDVTVVPKFSISGTAMIIVLSENGMSTTDWSWY